MMTDTERLKHAEFCLHRAYEAVQMANDWISSAVPDNDWDDGSAALDTERLDAITKFLTMARTALEDTRFEVQERAYTMGQKAPEGPQKAPEGPQKAPSGDFSSAHLTGEARVVADLITNHLRGQLGREPYGGGSRVYYSPEEWRERHEEYHLGSILIITYDGGDLSYILGGHAHDDAGLGEVLREHGYYTEAGTHWYSGVYRT